MWLLTWQIMQLTSVLNGTTISNHSAGLATSIVKATKEVTWDV